MEIGASGRTTLVWDGWDYLQSYAGSKPLDYHTVDGLILAQRMDEDYAEYLPDFLGTVAAYADESGSALAEARYKPYGLPLWSSGPVGDFAFGWVGQWGYRQSVEGIYVRRRHYLPWSQWGSADQLLHDVLKLSSGIISGHAYFGPLYQYALMNPVSFRDRTGLSAEPSANLDVSAGLDVCTTGLSIDFLLFTQPVNFSVRFCLHCYDTRCCPSGSAENCLEIVGSFGWSPSADILDLIDLNVGKTLEESRLAATMLSNVLFGYSQNIAGCLNASKVCRKRENTGDVSFCVRGCLVVSSLEWCISLFNGKQSVRNSYGWCAPFSLFVGLDASLMLCADRVRQ